MLRRGCRRYRLAVAVCALAGAVEVKAADPFVRVPGFAGMAVRSAIQGAARRLDNPRCKEIFSEFTDEKGRTLQSILDARGQSARDHLLGLRFYDGAIHPRCGQRGIYAVTWPGSSIVYVCPQAFLEAERNPFIAETYIIHEELHTLGLGENPPTSEEITDRIKRTCRI